MGSKYSNKLGKMSHTDRRKEAFKEKYSYCSNCGRQSYISDSLMTYSKCGCGGTFQSYRPKQSNKP